MRSCAILIDGGFLKRKVGSRQNPLTAESFQAFVTQLRGHEHLRDYSLHRIYYYDAPPLEGTQQRPLQGGTQDFGNSALAGINKRLVQGLKRVPYVSLRMGKLVFRGWQVRRELLQQEESEQTDSVRVTSEDLSPIIHQRGVDIKLGLDIAMLTFKRLVQAIVLVTADSDFAPAMRFARRDGMHVFLAPLGHILTEEMLENSDMIIEMADNTDAREGPNSPQYHQQQYQQQRRWTSGAPPSRWNRSE